MILLTQRSMVRYFVQKVCFRQRMVHGFDAGGVPLAKLLYVCQYLVEVFRKTGGFLFREFEFCQFCDVCYIDACCLIHGVIDLRV